MIDGQYLDELEKIFLKLSTQFPDNDVSLLRALIGNYGDRAVAQGLVEAKALGNSKEVASNMLSQQFEMWFTDKKSVNTVFKLLNLDKYTHAGFVTTSGLDVLEGYIKLVNSKTLYRNNDVSMLGTLVAKYGEKSVAKGLAEAKSVASTKDIATEMQTQQLNQWLKEGKSVDAVFTLLRLDEYPFAGVISSRGLDTLEQYITLFNRDKSAQESFFDAKTNKFTAIMARDLETTLLRQRIVTTISNKDGLKGLLNGNNLEKMDRYVMKLRTTHENNDISLLGALFAEYGENRIVYALTRAQNVESTKDTATNLLTRYKIPNWLKEGKSADDVIKLLKPDGTGKELLTHRALYTLEEYIMLYNRQTSVQTSFIKTVSKYFGGDAAFSIRLQGFKSDAITKKEAKRLQIELFRQGVTNVITSVKSKLNTLRLGKNIEAALESSSLAKMLKATDKLNKNNDASKQTWVIDTLITKYGDDAVTKALVNAKQTDHTNEVVTKLEKELFTRWRNKIQFPENVFSSLKILNEEDMVLRIGKIEVLSNYITFFNGKADQKETLYNVLSNGFANKNTALSTFAMAKKDPLTMKTATELETRVLLEKVSGKIVMAGGLEKVSMSDIKLSKLNEYVTTLGAKSENADISLLGALLIKNSDETIAKALVQAKHVASTKTIATDMQTQQFKMWLKEGKSVDDVVKLLKLDKAGDKVIRSRGLDTLEGYITLFNQKHDKSLHESFIGKISALFGGENKFAVKLEAFKVDQLWRNYANELQNKLFQKWKSEGLDSTAVISKVFNVRTTEKTTNEAIRLTANQFNTFLEKSENKVPNVVNPALS
ncbi:Avirulence (Avh) protein [Phytophthora megakarya]|uniref:Avirulence (Avh) protein n=1 Tax=Phytophthora megakarya TaxID=4795 RepID=A0A225WJ70_9STRA|nr:Avirulence (Avh) protein [Phytophthora megakarya]